MCSVLEEFNPKRLYYLKRIETDKREHLIIPFKKDEVLIGRGKTSDYMILDELISRSHALFQRCGKLWTVKNLSATNGVLLNKCKIPYGEESSLQVGDILQLGLFNKFCFRFGMKQLEKKINGSSQSTNTNSSMESESGTLSSQRAALEERLSRSEASKETLLVEQEQILSAMKAERDSLQQRFLDEQKELERKLSEGVLAQQSAVEDKEALALNLQTQVEELQKRHEMEKASLEQHLRAQEEIKANILRETEELAVRLQAEKGNLEKQLVEERFELEKKLAEEKCRLEGHLSVMEEQRTQLQKEVEAREQSLKLKAEEQEQLKEEQRKEAQDLKEERERLAERLKEVEMNLEEKTILTSALVGELEEKSEVEKRLEALVADKQALELRLSEAVERGAQVDELRAELDFIEATKLSLICHEEEAVHSFSGDASEAARLRVVESVSDVMDSELQCAICSELFITAMMLNCSHTFCKFCIDSWKKNKNDCPHCRAPIRSETRSIVVDNFIDKIVSTLSDDMKRQRNELIEERKAAVAAAEAATQAAAEAAAAAQAPRRGGRQNRGRNQRVGSVTTRRGRQAQTRAPPAPRSIPAAAVSASTRSTTASAASSTRTNPPNQPQPPPSAQQQQPPEVITLPGPSYIAPIIGGSPLITIESDSHDDSSDSRGSSERDSDESSSESGDSETYFGGYGRCYVCGRRGHWARGCPSRW